MKLTKIITPALTAIAILFAPAATFAKKKGQDEITHDGLHRVDTKRGPDKLFTNPNADFSQYTDIIIDEPDVAFRKHWQSEINSGRTLNRISDDDMVQMANGSKDLLVEQFSKRLDRKGYPVVDTPDSHVLLVKPSIINLEINAPDPNREAGIWNKVYAESAGEATLVLELYDSVTGEILARAIDRQRDIGDFNKRMPRTQFTNINDARSAFSSWAAMFTNQLDKATKA